MGLCIGKAGKTRCCWGVFFGGLVGGLGRGRESGFTRTFIVGPGAPGEDLQ